MAYKVTGTETVGTPGGNVPHPFEVTVQTLDQAAGVISGLIKAAALDPNVEQGGFSVTEL